MPFQWTVCGEVPSWWPCSEQNVPKDTLWCLFSGKKQFSAVSAASYSVKNEHALPTLLISPRDHCVTLCQDLVSRSKFRHISPNYGKISNLCPFCLRTTVPGHSGGCNSVGSTQTTIQLHRFRSDLLPKDLLHCVSCDFWTK